MSIEINSKITIIVPAKNEEQTIGEILDKLLLDFNAHNIIVVDDRSSDRTAFGKKKTRWPLEKKFWIKNVEIVGRPARHIRQY